MAAAPPPPKKNYRSNVAALHFHDHFVKYQQTLQNYVKELNYNENYSLSNKSNPIYNFINIKIKAD